MNLGLISIGALAAAGASYAWQLAQLRNGLSMNTTGSFGGFKGGNAVIEINVELNNTSNVSAIVTKPRITVFNDDMFIGDSIATNEKVHIRANGQSIMSGIKVLIPMVNLLRIAPELYQIISTGGTLFINVTARSKVTGFFGSLPFSNKEVLSINVAL